MKTDGSGTKTRRERVALGFKLHTGWAATVAVGLDGGQPRVVDRRRVELIDGSVPGQVYHAAKDMTPAKATQLVARVEKAAARSSKESLQQLCDELRAAGHDPTVAAVVASEAQIPSSIERVLASHTLLHAGEGALFRDAVMEAAEGCGLAVTHVPPKQLWQQAETALGVSEDAIRDQLTELGRELGPPWRQDHKEATVAAWMALATAGPARRGGRGGRAPAPARRGRPRPS